MGGKIQWVVRGVDQDLARQFVERAASRRRKAGEVLNEVLRAWLEGQPDGQDEPGRGIGQAPPEAGPPTPGLADEIAKLKDRIAALEEREPRMTRIEALEDRVDKLEETAGLPGPRVEPEKAAEIPMPLEAAPEPSDVVGEHLVTGGEGTRRRLTPAGVAEVERWIRDGIGDSEIASRVGMDRGAIRQRRLKLQSHVDENPAPPVEAATEPPTSSPRS